MQEKEQYELRMLMHSLSTMVENLQAAQEMDWQKHLWMAVRNVNIKANV